MPYTLEEFCDATREILTRVPGLDGQEKVRAKFERLLQDPAFRQRFCGADRERGLYRIYEDPALGFEVLVHLNARARKSPPHDHGESWAIYGQVSEHVDITNYRRTDDRAAEGRATLVLRNAERLLPGHARLFAQGDIHAIDYPDNAIFARVTGRNLDLFHRDMYDLQAGTVRRMTPQQAS